MNLFKLLSFIFIMGFYISNVSAEGNISITSGDLNLLANPGSGSQVNIFQDTPRVVFNTAADRFTFRMQPSGDYAYFYLEPNSNSAERTYLAFGKLNSVKKGLGFGTALDENKKVYPWSDREYDLGSSDLYWDNCYCSNIHYDTLSINSKGYLGSLEKAYDVVENIQTLSDGEINHSSVDQSLKNIDDSINTDSVTFANSKAIAYLMSKIKLLEDENIKLRKLIS